MRILTIAAVLAAMASLTPMSAQAGPRHWVFDRIEDRIDRRENRRDEAVDHGRLDRWEDRVDRREDRCDRNNNCYTPRLDRWERHSWWKQWGR